MQQQRFIDKSNLARHVSDNNFAHLQELQTSVSQPPGRGTVPGPGNNYTGPREVLLGFVILVF